MTAFNKLHFKTIIYTFLILNVSLGYSADIKKHYYYLGGGGEPAGEKTIFDGDVELASKFIEKSDWVTTVSFNGGHKKTEDIIKNKMSKARNAGSFVEATYNDLISEMIGKIKNGELKSGDQLLVSINSHGAKKSENDKTHKIALAYGEAKELKNLNGAKLANLDRLQELVEVASAANVKLAIVDVSCYSGNTLNIKNDKTCIISASGSEHYGYAGTPYTTFFGNYTYTFGSEFLNSFKKGRNLEDVFLRARAVGTQPDFPMISTPEGLKVQEMLYKLITPYLNYNDKNNTDFSDQYSSNSKAFEEQSCSMKNNFNQFKVLLKELDVLQLTVDGSQGFESEFSSLKKSLDKYRAYQLKYEESLKNSLTAEKEITEILNRDFPDDKKLWADYAPMNLLTLDLDWSVNYWGKVYQDALAKNPGSETGNSKWLKEMVDNLNKKKEIIKHIKANLSDGTKKKISDHAELFAKSGETKKLADNVSEAAKKVYLALYKRMKIPESNPCRDFVL